MEAVWRWGQVTRRPSRAPERLGQLRGAATAMTALFAVEPGPERWSACISMRSPCRLHAASIWSLAYEWFLYVKTMSIS